MFHGYASEEFRFGGQDAILVHPNGPGNGRLALKTEYWDAFPEFELQLLSQGFHLCHLAHESRWAPDADIHSMAQFVKETAARHRLDPHCVCVGMSCGGLQAARLAQLHPEVVSLLYLDAPVLNLLSIAGLGAGARNDEFYAAMLKAHGLTPSSLVCFRDSPIDHMERLLPIPIFLVYGGRDDVVLYEENGKVLETYLNAHGGTLEVRCKEACGHHPHGLTDLSPLLRFVSAHQDDWIARG